MRADRGSALVGALVAPCTLHGAGRSTAARERTALARCGVTPFEGGGTDGAAMAVHASQRLRRL